MRKIAIIGCGGSGKSTLARHLGQRLGMPVHHLDSLYWKPGWVETPKAEWVAIQGKLCDQAAWVIDGNYGGTLDIRLRASDTVILLDLPTFGLPVGRDSAVFATSWARPSGYGSRVS